ncbi:MAG: hypothetical protein ACYS19_12120, partial [Planctomycetota bacterium]
PNPGNSTAPAKPATDNKTNKLIRICRFILPFLKLPFIIPETVNTFNIPPTTDWGLQKCGNNRKKL